MKQVVTLTGILFMGLLGSVVFPKAEADKGAEGIINRAVETLYIEGLNTRDFDLIREICIPETKLMGINNEGSLNVTTLDQWSRKFDPENPPFKKLDYDIQKIDVVGTAAQVKIVFLVDGHRRVTDFLNLLQIDGKWRIVNIIDY